MGRRKPLLVRSLAAALGAAVCVAVACSVAVESRTGAGTLSVSATTPVLWSGGCKELTATVSALAASSAPLAVTVTTTNGALFSDAGCATALAPLSFAANGSQSFYLKPTAGTCTLTASATNAKSGTFALSTALPTADLVLGQTDFSGVSANGGGTADSFTLSGPTSAFSDGTRLLVADTGNNRVLLWPTLPTTTNASATVVLGQPDFTSVAANQGGAASEFTLSGPTHAIFLGTGIAVVDAGNHRVLVWNTIPTSHDAAADFVLGQPDFTGNTANNPSISRATLNQPYAIASDGTQLVITDGGNHRLLLWTSMPNSSGAFANYLIGQTLPSTSTLYYPTGTPNKQNFNRPQHALFTAGALLVADALANRVLVFQPAPTGNFGTALAILGQSTINSIAANAGGLGSATLSAPTGLLWTGSQLLISDGGNGRVLGFNGLPIVSATPASTIAGSTDFAVPGLGNGATGFASPGIPGQSTGNLWLPDRTQNRVLRFPLP